MFNEFEGATALVSGGGTGIGFAVASRLASLNSHVIIVGRREEVGRDAVESIAVDGGSSEFIRADISNPQDVSDLFSLIGRTHERLDFAFNNAGASRPGTLMDMSPADFDYLFAVNTRGLWLCLREELALMESQTGRSHSQQYLGTRLENRLQGHRGICREQACGTGPDANGRNRARCLGNQGQRCGAWADRHRPLSQVPDADSGCR